MIKLIRNENKMRLINKLHKLFWARLFVIYLRYLTGGAILFSSIVKIRGGRFTTENGILAPVNSASHLFETLYQSGIYWNFLGWSQLIAALLVMTQIYSTLGAVLMFPIVVNIFFITISYNFAGTPIITGLLLLANVFLLLWDYHKLLPLVKKGSSTAKDLRTVAIKKEKNNLWFYTGLSLFLVTVFYVLLFERTPVYWFLMCVTIGLLGLLINARNISKQKALLFTKDIEPN
jgi:hypothetical protein